ncbi:MAG: hypothetical protein JSS60_04085 [Verrucomicrobia bacterium]|nr:hypothetical protein [Verrucomicrobiota bacterium]
MKEKSSHSSPCENAAVRVQYWFGKDKANLLYLDKAVSEAKDFSKKHKCDPVKTPRIPSHVEHLPLQGYVLSKKRRQAKPRQVTKGNPSKPLKITVDGSHCNVNQKNLNFIEPEYTLSSARVAYCRLKEHFLVSKRLKNLSKQHHTGPKRHQVVPIKSSSQQDLSQNPYLQEWGKIKEERHFHIGRIIKYLTD